MGETLLPIRAVSERVGIKKATIYKRMKAGSFPKQVKIDSGSYWVESEINQYISNAINNSRGNQA
jgi:prophage regulatory protein